MIFLFLLAKECLKEKKNQTILCVGRFLGQHIQTLKFDSVFSVNFIVYLGC